MEQKRMNERGTSSERNRRLDPQAHLELAEFPEGTYTLEAVSDNEDVNSFWTGIRKLERVGRDSQGWKVTQRNMEAETVAKGLWVLQRLESRTRPEVAFKYSARDTVAAGAVAKAGLQIGHSKWGLAIVTGCWPL